jgi:hypothetical protein
MATTVPVDAKNGDRILSLLEQTWKKVGSWILNPEEHLP